jgi:hypothetical protein
MSSVQLGRRGLLIPMDPKAVSLDERGRSELGAALDVSGLFLARGKVHRLSRVPPTPSGGTAVAPPPRRPDHTQGQAAGAPSMCPLRAREILRRDPERSRKACQRFRGRARGPGGIQRPSAHVVVRVAAWMVGIRTGWMMA